MRNVLKQAFPEGIIADYRETHPIITRGLDRSTTFLSLISLIALIIGALGVATAMHAHLQQKMDTIAVMKCLGARSGQVHAHLPGADAGAGPGGRRAGRRFGMLVQRAFPGSDRPLLSRCAAAHGTRSGPRARRAWRSAS